MLAQSCQDDMEWRGDLACICRIPQYLKDGESKDYEPQIISFGPYHHGKEHLRPMDQHKLRCLRRILTRSNHEIDPYLNAVKDVEGKARSCYNETISMNSDDFVQMMVLDGCFLLELFLGFALGFGILGYRLSEPIFSMRGPMHMIQHDMILLENQIPLFICDQLLPLFTKLLPPLRFNQQLGCQHGPLNQNGLVAKLALNFLNGPPVLAKQELDLSRIQGVLHCLALFWLSLLPLSPEPKRPTRLSPSQQEMIPCVTDLWKAGIEFSMTEMNNFVDIWFKEGTLKIPQLQIHDGTRLLFVGVIFSPILRKEIC